MNTKLSIHSSQPQFSPVTHLQAISGMFKFRLNTESSHCTVDVTGRD